MWIAVVAVGLVVLACAAYAGLGHFGEMAPHGVIDRARGIVPDGPVTEEFLKDARPRPRPRRCFRWCAAATTCRWSTPSSTARFPSPTWGIPARRSGSLAS